MAEVTMSGDRVSLRAGRHRAAGPVVVVTGASAGVGRAVSRRFAQKGARVALIARGADGLEGARQDVERLGGEALVIQADVAEADAVDNAAEHAERELGPIDIWVNNATTTVFSRIREMTAEEFRRVTEVAYLGYVHGTLSALKRMLPRDRGTVVQVGSALSYRAIPLQSAYCAAKHAIQGFTESLRCELMHDGSHVRVTMVHMPALNTPQFGWNRTRMPRHPQPVPPIYQPELAAEAVYYAAFHDRVEMAVGWPTVAAVYGNRIAPRLLDRQLARTGFDSQQTDGPVQPGRPDNLWEPLPGDRGAHGAFDDRSWSFSPQFWANKNRKWLMLGACVVGSAAALWRVRR
ncbi:MAG TPA: SDR family oxidoreductase [Bryobacteraceae bacterium]|nr:SDR family oxidoreductase [Bryobacteraceae bacterium]